MSGFWRESWRLHVLSVVCHLRTIKLFIMDTTARTRDAFLMCMAAIYTFAFGSIYIQIPGLYGKNGVLPVGSLIQAMMEENPGKSAEGLFMKSPTLLWFMKIDPHIGLELLSILGIVLSFPCMIWQRIRVAPIYVLLWLLYMSIYKVGETFMWFQWDILLLEVGFIAIFVAPLSNKKSDTITEASMHRQLPFYLLKWLLFRLMFASGVVKLTSNCPTWWGLTALNYHYETQCIPTPLSWWAHQLPDNIQQLSVITTYIIEILLPLLFFSPFRVHRLVAGYGQVILMVAIYLSGNYNFFNLLTAVLCLSLIDDSHLDFIKSCFTCGFCRKNNNHVVEQRRSMTLMKVIINLVVLSFGGYFITRIFNYEDGKFSIVFTQSDLQVWLKWIMPYLVTLGVVSFVVVALTILYRSVFKRNNGFKGSLKNLIKFTFVLAPSVYILTISMARFSDIEPTFQSKIWPIANDWYRTSNNYNLVHSYGLFRRMTGVGGRPEVIIEGSNSPDGKWQEYHFVYKPGKKTNPPLWAAPHQPRLDWQMWFAALGNYQHNTWIISLMHRLLIGQPEVLDLLDRSKNPFPNHPPKFVRAQLYHYHFTKLKKDGSVPKAWWKRELNSTYIPPITKDDKNVVEFLKYNKLLPTPPPKKKLVPGRIESSLKSIRIYVENVSPPVLLWSFVVAAFCISFVGNLLSSDTRNKKDKE